LGPVAPPLRADPALVLTQHIERDKPGPRCPGFSMGIFIPRNPISA